MVAQIPSAENPAPFQFGLKHLFGFMLAVCVFLALATQGYILGATLFVLLVSIVTGIWFRKPVLYLGVPLFILFMMCMLPMPITRVRGPHRQTHCINNIKQIVLALHNYHDTYGSFPPAYIADESGKPMHSWRVLLLPFLEQYALYDLYNFDEPWDGPNNRKLHSEIAHIYQYPSDNSPATNYVAVVGSGTAWPVATASKFSDFKDATSNTIVVVEVANSGIHWMEPRDLDAGRLLPIINPIGAQGISSEHPGGVHVAYADGSAYFLPDALDGRTLDALLSINGKEKIKKDRDGTPHLVRPSKRKKAAK